MGRASTQKLAACWSRWGGHRAPLAVGGVPCGSVGVRPTQSRAAPPGNRDTDLRAGRGGGQERAGRQASSLLRVTRTPGTVEAPAGGGGGDASEAAVGGVQPEAEPSSRHRPQSVIHVFSCYVVAHLLKDRCLKTSKFSPDNL